MIMKHLIKISAFIFAFILFSCSNNTDNAISMVGNYSLTNQAYYQGDSLTNPDMVVDNQMKVYSDNAWMFIAIRDGVGAFSAGTYDMEGDLLTEHAVNVNPDSSGNNFTLRIVLTESGYNQIIDEILDNDGNAWKLEESYERHSAGESSDLDGLYRQSQTLNIIDGDTTDVSYNEFKMIHQGEFMWGAQAQNEDGTVVMHVGHGTVSVDGDMMTEELEESSMEGITGTYHVKIERIENGFSQTITDEETGNSNIKTYIRIQ